MNSSIELLFFILSLLPAFLIGLYVYEKDREKEPAKLLLKLALGGVLSTILTLIISGILGIFFPIFNTDTENLNLVELFFYVFVGVALVEEFSKWIIVYKISYNDRAFDHVYDMIVYSVFVALGFAGLENLLYVYSSGIFTALLRFVLAVPGHACDGVFIGYYLGLAKLASVNGNEKLSKKYKLLSLVVPTILHGIYDYCIFTSNFISFMLFIIFIIFVYVFSIKKVNQFSRIPFNFVHQNKFCPKCGNKIESPFCPKCGNKNE